MSNDNTLAIAIRPFVAGSLASVISSLCLHPLDLTSARTRVPTLVTEETKNGFGIAKLILKDEGVRGFFSGVSAAITRHAVYGATKIGLHDRLSECLKKQNEDQPIPFYQKALSAMSSGALAAILGSPFDLVLMRMVMDNGYPVNQRRNYKNPFHAIYRIAKEEGLRTLWRGCTPMVFSSISTNVGMLAFYDQAKEAVIPYFGTGVKSSLIASAIGSFICSFMTLPFDMLKTRMLTMNMDPETRKYPYRNIFDCAVKVIRKGGPLSLWRGFSMYYVRVAPYSIITLLTKDTINSAFTDAYIN